jgi:hypothetical protein
MNADDFMSRAQKSFSILVLLLLLHATAAALPSRRFPTAKLPSGANFPGKRASETIKESA